MKKLLITIAAILAISNLAIFHALYLEKDRDTLLVAFLDVGQGDAIYIEAPNGNQILFDAGPNAKVVSELGRVMPWYDKSLDMIVVTNPDKDHIAGFIPILKRFDVSYLLEPGTENKSQTNMELKELVKTKGLETILARRGLEIILDEKAGVVLTVLFPDVDVTQAKTNDGSIIARLVYGETEIMLTGDAPIAAERAVLAYASTTIQSDILKVGHHGSKTSTDFQFAKMVAPQFAVISSGKGNIYGHPHKEILETLSQFPIEVLRTDTHGAAIFVSDGVSFQKVN